MNDPIKVIDVSQGKRVAIYKRWKDGKWGFPVKPEIFQEKTWYRSARWIFGNWEPSDEWLIEYQVYYRQADAEKEAQWLVDRYLAGLK